MQKRQVSATATAAVIALTALFPATATGKAGEAGTTEKAGQAAAPGTWPTALAECEYTRVKPVSVDVGLPDFDPDDAAQPYKVRLHTTQGRIEFEALTTKAPCTTNSFRFLAEKRYYNRTHCHRATTQRIFVLQCGDPTGAGGGAPGYRFPDENLEGATYPAGTVAMANAGPDTNGSQFFFTWKDTTLAPNFTPFGRVTKGMDVLRKIGEAGTDEQNNPGDGYPRRFTEFRKVKIFPER